MSEKPQISSRARNSAIVTALFAALAAGIYFFGIEPSERELDGFRARQAEGKSQSASVESNLKESAEARERLAALRARKAEYAAALLEPLLESTAMRAKELLEPLALGAGLSSLEFDSMANRSLPVPRPVPKQLHARAQIQMRAVGTYQAAASFVLRLEKEFPLVTLQSFVMNAHDLDADNQDFTMIFEWPTKGKVVK